MFTPSIRMHLAGALVVPVLLVLSLAATSPARAQPASGEIGIYLNPEGTANYIGYCPSGGCGEEYLWKDQYGRDAFTVHILVSDLPGNVGSYSLGLRIPDYSLIVPHFPEGTDYAFTLSDDYPYGSRQISFEITPPDCIDTAGLIELGSSDVIVVAPTGFSFLVRLVTTNPTLGVLGYSECPPGVSSLHQWTIAGGGNEVGIFYPDPAPTSTMGTLKSWY